MSSFIYLYFLCAASWCTRAVQWCSRRGRCGGWSWPAPSGRGDTSTGTIQWESGKHSPHRSQDIYYTCNFAICTKWPQRNWGNLTESIGVICDSQWLQNRNTVFELNTIYHVKKPRQNLAFTFNSKTGLRHWWPWPSHIPQIDSDRLSPFIGVQVLLDRGGQQYSKMYRLKRYRYTIFENKIE
jgi:hypothetical protein